MGLDIDILDSFGNKKRKFIEAYTSSFGNITESSRIAGVARATFYNWINDDPDFKRVIDSIQPEEIALDFAEKQLFKRIKGESDACLIFFLKTKGKSRGYVEKIQTEDVTSKPKRYTLNINNNENE